jgi:hypothetical protein
MPVLEFVESLITKGLDTVMGRPALHSAMERIRALRSPETGAKR